MRAKKKNNLIFLHVYKTAGTTLRDIVCRNFRRNDTYWLKSHLSDKEFTTLPGEKREKFKLLYGHMLFGLHRYMKPGSRYISVLRNPADRVISEYYYNMSHPEFPDHDMLVNKKITDPLIFAQSGVFVLTDNGQVRILGEAYDKPFGSIGQHEYDKAIENIEKHFDFIATIKHFDEMAVMMAETYGWKKPWYIRLNEGEKRKKTDEAMRNEILRMNQWDVKLCEYVEARMQRMIDEKGMDFKKRVGRFKKRNKKLAFFLKIRVHLDLLVKRFHHS